MSTGDGISGIRTLRAETGASLRDCKRALAGAGGDLAQARQQIERDKLARVQREAGCSQDEAAAALVHAKGVVERAIEVARMPSVVVEPEFVRVTKRARRFLAEEGAAGLGLYELRDALPHANAGPARDKLALVLEFHSVLATMDVETLLEHEDNDAVATLDALEAVRATRLAGRLRRALDGPRHREARDMLNGSPFEWEGPLLAAVLDYIAAHPELAS